MVRVRPSHHPLNLLALGLITPNLIWALYCKAPLRVLIPPRQVHVRIIVWHIVSCPSLCPNSPFLPSEYVASETRYIPGPHHPVCPRIQESVILPVQVWFSCQLGMRGTFGEARAASWAKTSSPRVGLYLSLPGYAGGSAGLHCRLS